mmetsp:Transcript_1212/g.4837  ORF Transcript_1212/g.4837 Transcript_1212/m.4837 type:complete len:308 (+) Transcript_1212:332-1255(+)
MSSDVFSSGALFFSAPGPDPAAGSARASSALVARVSPPSPFERGASMSRFECGASFASSVLVDFCAFPEIVAPSPSSAPRTAGWTAFSSRAAAAASSGALRMACENFATVLMSATISARLSAAACMSSGRSSTLSAVPRPSSCSLPCSLHFWHDTQSITSLMLWNTPLNCDLSDGGEAPDENSDAVRSIPTSLISSFISSATALNSALSSNAPNTPEHEDRMCVSSSRRSNAAVRASSAGSWPSATSVRASASEAFRSARSSTTKEKCRFLSRSGCSPYMRWNRAGSGLHTSRPGVFFFGGFALRAT